MPNPSRYSSFIFKPVRLYTLSHNTELVILIFSFFFFFVHWHSLLTKSWVSSISEMEHCRVMVGVYRKSECSSSKQSAFYWPTSSAVGVKRKCYLFLIRSSIIYALLWVLPAVLSILTTCSLFLHTVGCCWPVNTGNISLNHGPYFMLFILKCSLDTKVSQKHSLYTFQQLLLFTIC